jgi:hypothetical protein
MGAMTPAVHARCLDRLRAALAENRPLNYPQVRHDLALALCDLEHFQADAAHLRAEKEMVWYRLNDDRLTVARDERERLDAHSVRVLEFPLGPAADWREARADDEARVKRGALDIAAWCAVALIWCMAAVVIAKAFGWIA